MPIHLTTPDVGLVIDDVSAPTTALLGTGQELGSVSALYQDTGLIQPGQYASVQYAAYISDDTTLDAGDRSAGWGHFGGQWAPADQPVHDTL